jgi:hypothetical protein
METNKQDEERLEKYNEQRDQDIKRVVREYLEKLESTDDGQDYIEDVFYRGAAWKDVIRDSLTNEAIEYILQDMAENEIDLDQHERATDRWLKERARRAAFYVLIDRDMSQCLQYEKHIERFLSHYYVEDDELQEFKTVEIFERFLRDEFIVLFKRISSLIIEEAGY